MRRSQTWHFMLGSMLFLLCFALASCANQTTTPAVSGDTESHLAQGRELLKADKVSEAIQEFQTAINWTTSVRRSLFVGQLTSAGAMDDAAKVPKALESNPIRGARANLASLPQGNHKSESEFKQALSILPNDAT